MEESSKKYNKIKSWLGEWLTRASQLESRGARASRCLPMNVGLGTFLTFEAPVRIAVSTRILCK